jgi:hypothetical protein
MSANKYLLTFSFRIFMIYSIQILNLIQINVKLVQT